MRKMWSSAAQRLESVRHYSNVFRRSVALLQRGNPGQSSGGGSRYGNGAQPSPPRQQYPPQRGGGSNSGGGYGNRPPQQGYESRDSGYGNRQRGYNNNRDRYEYGDNRRQCVGSRPQGFEDRPRGFFNRDGDDGGSRQRGGNFGGRPPRRSPSDYLQKDAETLLQMKQAYKQSKTTKERVQILREARHLIRKVRVDASTQDERSVIVFLNCAATFKSRVFDGLEEASRWVQANLRGLSPHNVALYANALGVLELDKREELFRATLVPLLPSIMRDMTPVEVVMVLQAFERLFIDGCDELKDELLFQLEPCIPTMPVPQLSTLAEVLVRHSLRQRNEEKWRQVVQEVMHRALASVETMHSKEAIAFLDAAPSLELPQEQLCSLLARATATARFHNDEQIGVLFRNLCKLKRRTPEPTPEFEAAVAELTKALIVRLEKVTSFMSVDAAAIIWLNAADMHIELPTAVAQAMCDQVRLRLTYKTTRVPRLARLAKAISVFKLPSTELLDVVAKYAVGERPPRPHNAAAPEEGHEDDPEAEEEVEGVRATTREMLYARYFRSHVQLRMYLEEAYAKHDASPPAVLTTTLPEHLLKHIPDATARQLLVAMWDVLSRPPGCPCRNVANDEALYQGVLNDIARTPEKYKQHVSPALVARMKQELAGNAKGEELIAALQRSLQ